MRKVLLGLIAIAELGTSSAVQAEDIDPRFKAFRSACVEARDSYDSTIAQVAAEGWSKIAESDHPYLQRIFEIGRDPAIFKAQGIDPDDVEMLAIAAYRKELEGQVSYLALSHVAFSGERILGCRLYDFAAEARLDPSSLTQWLGEPTFVQNQDGFFQQKWLSPTVVPGAATVIHAYFPLAAADAVGFSGLNLSITSLLGNPL